LRGGLECRLINVEGTGGFQRKRGFLEGLSYRVGRRGEGTRVLVYLPKRGKELPPKRAKINQVHIQAKNVVFGKQRSIAKKDVPVLWKKYCVRNMQLLSGVLVGFNV